MDLSKLPKLSQTVEAERARAQQEENPPQGDAGVDKGPQATRRPESPYDQSGAGAEVWLSGVIGVVFMFMGATFARYLLARLTGGEFHTGWVWPQDSPKAGQEVAYYELQGYTGWTDTSVFLFGVALMMDAVLLAVGGARRGVAWVALVVTGIAVLFNVVTALMVMSVGIPPLISLLALAMGGYMLVYQWKLVMGAPRGIEARG